METSNEIIHGKCLNAMDIENLRHFVQDYTVRALIPYVEHLVIILNDAVCIFHFILEVIPFKRIWMYL